MASQINNYIELVSQKLKILPLVKQQEVLDFVEFLIQKSDKIKSQQKRVPNLNQGQIWMSDNFNDSLSHDFWLKK